MPPTSYRQFDRADMLPLVPEGTRRLLDVGCAGGRFAELLKRRRTGLEIWGIDPTSESDDAVEPYVERIVGYFPDDLPAQQFDCVVFNDSLEHLPDPEAALGAVRERLDPGGSVVASIPNVRHVRVLKPLLLEGQFRYADDGILDRTHLHLFTRSSMTQLFEGAGFEVSRVEPRSLSEGRLAKLNRLARGRLVEFVAQQFALVATRR